MTKKQFEKLVDEYGFIGAVGEFTYAEEIDEINTFDTLIDYVHHCLDEGDYYLARHILNNINEDIDYYIYDFSMGTLQDPESINSIEDLSDYFD